MAKTLSLMFHLIAVPRSGSAVIVFFLVVLGPAVYELEPPYRHQDTQSRPNRPWKSFPGSRSRFFASDRDVLICSRACPIYGGRRPANLTRSCWGSSCFFLAPWSWHHCLQVFKYCACHLKFGPRSFRKLWILGPEPLLSYWPPLVSFAQDQRRSRPDWSVLLGLQTWSIVR